VADKEKASARLLHLHGDGEDEHDCESEEVRSSSGTRVHKNHVFIL
jgi:hypothetical protein